ncbi:MAG: 50S ribosomal protein L15 [Bacteroidales bacterium]|nr:50S ribosomal protein L15 [Bacteroidales bacterium]MDD4362343.1 50S ribosomal protein L15 [Bacteroidales bacterium]MDD4430351.1 50S ribosomal protein L15 [Bacteroidales bacterium]
MNLNNLKPAPGSVKSRKRIGRGPGSGMGGTSTRGHKGAKSRSGYSKKRGFEGGQMPLQRRLPKFGFTNINRVEYKAINLDTLQALADNKSYKVINRDILLQAGFISSTQKVKILAKGSLSASLQVVADAFSATAVKAIEAAGGTAQLASEFAAPEKAETKAIEE